MNNKKIAKKWYKKILDKDKVSETFLKDSLCFYEQPPERVVNFLNELPKEDCEKLAKSFTIMRENAVKYCKENKLSKNKEDEIFTQFVQGKIKGE